MELILPFCATTSAPQPTVSSDPSPAAKTTSTPSDTGERLLILVKHSLPDIDPRIPANEWHLGEEGRKRCAALADRLAVYRPTEIVTSDEPKAVETGADLARRLHLTRRTAPSLHEHDRRRVAFLGDAAFKKAINRFFAHPNERVLGAETARQAARRFADAVDRVLTAHPDGNVIIVAHGTVISLFVAAHADVDPFDLWQRLGLPSFVVL